MSIRLREVDGIKVALCAALTKSESGDVYIHDGWHYALAMKFMRDWEGNGTLPSRDRLDPIEYEVMKKEEGSDMI